MILKLYGFCIALKFWTMIQKSNQIDDNENVVRNKFFSHNFVDLEIDPCDGNDCDQTNGECIPSGTTFMCMCKEGFTGDGKSCTRNFL